MKKALFLVLLLSLTTISTANAQYTNGYMRSNGTYVNGYTHTAPDSNPYNNYSYHAPSYSMPTMPTMQSMPTMPTMQTPSYGQRRYNNYNMPLY